MKKTISVAMLSSALVISGCASTGGLATSANGGCNTGMSTAVGALLGAAIGASVGDSSYAATGAAIGGAVFAAGCLMINAHTIQKKSAAEVETAYKKANPLQRVQEKLVLKDANGKVIRELVKDVQVSTAQGYSSGDFENSFSWKFPSSVSKGQYLLVTVANILRTS